MIYIYLDYLQIYNSSKDNLELLTLIYFACHVLHKSFRWEIFSICIDISNNNSNNLHIDTD